MGRLCAQEPHIRSLALSIARIQILKPSPRAICCRTKSFSPPGVVCSASRDSSSGVQRSACLHRAEQFTVCSILPYHALLSHISHEIQNFFTHFAFILFYLVIVKCGKICGNTLKPQIGFVVCVHLIYYTHQYHPCQIETISKKKRVHFCTPSSFIQGTHRFPHGLGILA